MNTNTIGNRLVLHLSYYSRFKEEFVCPVEMTQDGISEKIGISRAHAALELKRLKQRGHVDCRLAHVARTKTRRKVYFLTKPGEEHATGLKDIASHKRLRVIEDGGGQEHPGHEILKLLTSRGYSENEAYVRILASEAISLDRGRVDDGGNQGRAQLNVIGRAQETSRLERWFNTPGKTVCLLTGPGGIGKSHLALDLISKVRVMNVKISVRQSQSVRSIISEIANTLSKRGKLRLKRLMECVEFDAHEVVLTLTEEMAGGLLVLEELQNSPEIEEFTSQFMKLNEWPLKVLLVSRRKPGYCKRWSDTFQKPYEDISLNPFNLEATRELISYKGIKPTDEQIRLAHTWSRGHPLEVAMLVEHCWPPGSDDPPNIIKRVLAQMNRDELRFIGLSAIIRLPIDPATFGDEPIRSTLDKYPILFQREEDGYKLRGFLKDQIMGMLSEEEKGSLHAVAADIEESRRNTLEAALHLISAGNSDRAIDVLVRVQETLDYRTRDSELLPILQSIGDEPRLDHLRGRILASLGRNDEARLYLERALLNDVRNESHVIAMQLADIKTRMGMMDDAEQTLVKIIGSDDSRSGGLLKVQALQLLGNLNRLRFEFRKAIQCFQETLVQSERLGEPREAVRARASIGMLHLESKDAESAAGELSAAINALGEDDVDSAKLFFNLGLANRMRGDEERSSVCFLKSAEIAKSFGQMRINATSLAYAAESYFATGRTSEALTLNQEALKIAEHLEDSALSSLVHANLGTINRKLGLWSKAESHLIKSVDLIKSREDHDDLCRVYKEMAMLYQSNGDLRKARLWNRRSMRMKEWEMSRPRSNVLHFQYYHNS